MADGNQGNLFMSLFEPGDEVEAHPATDCWMAGDRFGIVKSIGHKYIHVLMDRSNKVRKFSPENLLHRKSKI